MVEFCSSTPRVSQRLDDLEHTISRLDELWVLAETSSQRQTEIENRLAQLSSSIERPLEEILGPPTRGTKSESIVDEFEKDLTPAKLRTLFAEMATRINKVEIDVSELRDVRPVSSNGNGSKHVAVKEDETCHDVVIGTIESRKTKDGEDDAPVHGISAESTSTITDIREDTYELRESIWDVTFFLGHPVLGWLGTMYIVFCLTLTIVVILAFNEIISEDLTNPSVYGDEHQRQLQKWRTHFGHLLDSADPVTGTSLVAAVCHVDKSLMTSSPHVSIVNNLINYLPGDYAGPKDLLVSGPVLCLLALFVWYLILTEEISTIINLSRSLSMLPLSGAMTKLEVRGTKLAVVRLGRSSLIFGMLFLIARVVLCVMLANSGTMFILHTISMQDLILNCAALRIVLDMDELIFEVLMPLHVRCMMAALEPLPARSWPERDGLDCWSVFCLLSILVSIVLVGNFQLAPFVKDLESTYGIVCGGDRDFVVTADITGRPWATRSNPFGEHIPEYEEILAHAVKDALDSTFERTLEKGWLSWGGYHAQRFGLFDNRPIDEVERLRRLVKKDKFNTFYEYSPSYTAEHHYNDNAEGVVHLRKTMQNESVICDGISEIQSDFSCYQRWGEKVETTLRIQAMCPEGCGCSSVYRGTIYKRLGGCPLRAVHAQSFPDELTTIPCENPGVHSSSALLDNIRKWMQGPEVIQFCEYNVYNGLPQPCIDPTEPSFCDNFYEHFHNMHTILPAICPIRFGCYHGNVTIDNILFCPTACNASTR